MLDSDGHVVVSYMAVILSMTRVMKRPREMMMKVEKDKKMKN